MKATKRLIDAVWTVEFYILSEGKVVIMNYARDDPEGYNREKELPQCELIEIDNRIVTHLWLKPYKSNEWVNKDNVTEIYEVVNPQHIFSYNKAD